MADTAQRSTNNPEHTGVTIRDVADFSLVQFAAWPDTLNEVGTLAAKAAGCAKAPRPGRAATGTAGTLLRPEPLKWWLFSHAAIPGIDIEAAEGVTLDLSSSRTLVQLSGPKAATLLNHFLPLDLREASFPDGSIASTGFHHVGVTLWRDGETWKLFLPRSFAESLLELLHESARQYQIELAD